MAKSKKRKAVAARKPRLSRGRASGKPIVAYQSRRGRMLIGRIEDLLDTRALAALRGKTNLIFTSPAFPLVHKKRYGNETGSSNICRLDQLAPRLCDLLAPD